MLRNYILEKIILPLGDTLTKTSYIKQLINYRKEGSKNKAELIELQKTKLLATLKFAYQNVPYYQQLVIDFSSNDPYQILKQFPIVDKKKLIDNLEKFHAVNSANQKINTLYSSGSSGVQGKVFFTNQALSKLRAINTFMWEDTGYRIGDVTLQLGMTKKRSLIKSIKDLFFRVDYQRAFNLTDDEVLKILKKYNNKSKNAYFVGYASGLYTYAQVAKKHNLNITFKAVISFGDKMFSHYKELIETTFKCKVCETYGSNEGLTVGFVARDKNYYLLTNYVHVEIVDEYNKQVPNGQMGYAVITGLENYYMPLVRYKIGDLMELSEEEASDTNTFAFPLIKRVIGRDTDIVKTASGKTLIVHFFTAIMGKRDDIAQFRIIQSKQDEIEFEFIASPSFNKYSLTEIDDEIRAHVRESELKINYLKKESIPTSPSGKPQIVVSKIL
jgi:phenylacetate-CoA ligase